MAYCLLLIASCLLSVPIACCQLPIVYGLLPNIYCLLPIASCLLSIAYLSHMTTATTASQGVVLGLAVCCSVWHCRQSAASK